ncbi:thioredoxin family protein [Sedimenticola hydrogenitrophicus]|uniref:thioredoxin family protein n=1 Tax=Sedimenticola hydrogenitrophicus TaxID=2967975 RepID=UPI0021A4D8B1|nr:thioredoxin fold domain-containing protein [Sedimenticola hydrogenitrophicus]
MLKRIPFSRLLPLLLLFYFGTASAATEGRFFGARETVYPDWFKESFLDIREDVAEATAAGRRVLLFFHQNGCPYCNLMVERNLSQRDIAERMRREFDVIGVNMWGDRAVTDMAGEELTEKGFAAALRVQFTPTLLFLDESGQAILRLNGYIPPATFALALEYVGGRLEQQTAYRDFLASRQVAVAADGQLHSQPFFIAGPHDLSLVQEPLAIFFEQRDCPACGRMHRELLSDPEISDLVSRTHAIQLDMWAATPIITPDGVRTTAREWARTLAINYAPSVVLFDPQTGEVIRSEAFFKRFHTAAIFDYLLSGAYKTEPSFQRYLSARAEHIRAQGKDVDIWR